MQLLSWEEGTRGEGSKESVHIRVILFDESAQEWTAASRVVGGARTEIGHDLCKFASHQYVKYLKSGCLKIRVYRIQLQYNLHISDSTYGKLVLNNYQ